MIKLFKVGQLTLEYLMYSQNHSERALVCAEEHYKEQLKQSQALEDQVKDRQRKIVRMKNDLKVKKQTLRTYESLLKKPAGLPVDVHKCKVCMKYFATQDFLYNHYKRRHPDYYAKEVTTLERELMAKELGELDMKARVVEQKDNFVREIRTGIVDKYQENFNDLQDTLRDIKKQSMMF